jgi:hypothetical protein
MGKCGCNGRPNLFNVRLAVIGRVCGGPKQFAASIATEERLLN